MYMGDDYSWKKLNVEVTGRGQRLGLGLVSE